MALKQAELQQVIAPSGVKQHHFPLIRQVLSKAAHHVWRIILDLIVPCAIVVGFFFLQIWLDRELSSPITEIVTITSVIIEIAIIAAWNILCDSMKPVKRQ